FIPNSTLSIIEKDDRGFYWDGTRNPKAIQIFNPETMVRTGEIDLAAQINPYLTDEFPFVSFGYFMEVAGGKLYTMATFNSDNVTHGAYDETFIYVIDIETQEFEALIRYPESLLFGYFGLQNSRYTSSAEDGYVYLSAWCTSNFFPKATIIRIKAGETTVDPTFKIALNDFVGGNALMLGGATFLNGKLYTRLKESAAAPDFSNLSDPDIFLHEIDVATGQVTKIGGMPASTFGATGTVQGPLVHDDKIYTAVVNGEYQGYYVYDPAVGGNAALAFDIKSGIPSNLFILEESSE
ncbi:MAG: hypothetical protein AAF843_17045, partial [Bacteroidota bacterium]